MNWIMEHYPKGRRVGVVSTRSGKVEPATVVNHLGGSGFQARHTVGIIVLFDNDNQYQRIGAAFLDEEGGDCMAS